MVEIKGKLSDLFKDAETDIELTEELLDSMINSPIIKDYKCVGVVKYVNKDADEWSGFLLNPARATLSADMKCRSINLINLQ